ncbi:ribosomal protein L11 methyltransferase [Caldanaerobius fijiensis DSM 17918]|uniref:Ribosomal protein L11 methyltransferase n=1 Tax=Caldanaerobius fijiensis DSM 17918 TaxID=1121256 RepID=A0A1M4SEN0_9THEO|nr:50S ribosomal protein L11 methyltransferase [Caldanaerobius fijiensis]SHE30714.1 ribosomal protein L11 methyltransferase [Caldanaerobius fijiensis DSM 17918]
MSWIEVQVKTTRDAVDAVSNILYDVGAGGVVIEDFHINLDEVNEWDEIDIDRFIVDENIATVKGYLPGGPDLPDKINVVKERIRELRNYLNTGEGTISITEVYEEDWANSWKKYYKPVKIGPKIVVKPDWEEYEPEDGEIVIEMDPGMAFGTGTHETTRMCIIMLQKYVEPGMNVFDVGCGSGILAITAAKLGASRVLASDIDDVAVNVAKENVQKNGVSDVITVKKSDGLKEVNEIGPADLIVANIIADVIIKITHDVRENLKNNGIYIASGIIRDREKDVVEKLKTEGFSIEEIMYDGEWVTIGCVLNA